jgi:hypothetical protein
MHLFRVCPLVCGNSHTSAPMGYGTCRQDLVRTVLSGAIDILHYAIYNTAGIDGGRGGNGI